MYKILILPSATKDLDDLPSKELIRIKEKIFPLSENPRPWGSVKLIKEEGYRLRSGDYRILYRVDDKNKAIYIYRLKHRREAYK